MTPAAPRCKGAVAVGKEQQSGRLIDVKQRFQVQLKGVWQNCGKEEDLLLRRAFLVGQPNAKCRWRGQDYRYNFKAMTQKNLTTGKERKIRQPPNMSPPSQPLLPPGAVMVVVVPGGPGSTIEISDPNNPGRRITVALPAATKKGSHVAVPVPKKGEDFERAVEKQRKWTIGDKLAACAAPVGAMAVGGVLLGEHLSDGAFGPRAESAGAVAGGLAEATGAVDAASADATPRLEGAATDAAERVEGAAWDVGERVDGGAEEWAGSAVDDAEEWLAGVDEEDLGECEDAMRDFVMDLF